MKAAADPTRTDAIRANAQRVADEHATFAGSEAEGPLGQFVAASPLAAAQRARQASVDASPRMAAQRRQQATRFEPAAQMMPEEEELQMVPEEEELQMVSEEEEVQMMPEEEELQMKQDAGAPAQRLGEAPPNPTGMPDALKAGIESLSGQSLDDVRVHHNSSKPASLQARAFAQGTDIHLGPGQEQHLPHEAWHTVQQKQGRVQPTIESGGVPINDDPGLEHEADVMGRKALSAGEAALRKKV